MSTAPLRILLVTHYFPAHGGGIERVAASLAVRLVSDRAMKINWLASDTDPLPTDMPQDVACKSIPTWNGTEVHGGFPWPVWAPSAWRTVWREVGKADIVHVHDALYMGSALACLLARWRRVPVVVTQHIGTVPFRSRVLLGLHAFANRTLGRMVLSSADQVIFISPAVQAEFSRFCRFSTEPQYWPNGVDTKVFSPDGSVADDAEIMDARSRGRRVFLFVGRFVEKKGLSILKAMAAVRSEDLWLFAGHGPVDPSAWRLPNVRVIRGLSGEGLAAYYRAADLLVLPSVGEGFPLVVQEAMACGTPAMVGDATAAGCPAAASLLVIARVGDGDTVARWLQVLAALDSQPATSLPRRSEVAEFARSEWSWTVLARRYGARFDELVAKRQ